MRRSVPAVALAALLSACVVGDVPDEEPAPPIEPSFAPADPGTGSPTADAASPGDPSPEPGTPTPTAPATSEVPTTASTTTVAPTPRDTSRPATAPPGPSELSAAVTDPRGDTTGSLEREPAWSDLVGAELRKRGEAFTLWIDLAGGAPSGSGSVDHTMNIASFYDLDGDGGIDVEVWVNVADGGWDSAHYDNRDGSAAFSDGDAVEVRVEGDRLRVDFPASVLDGSSAFRWAVASEWGRYEQLGTALTVRDDAPDDDRPAAFPG